MILNERKSQPHGPIAIGLLSLLVFAASGLRAQGSKDAEPERTLKQMESVRKNFHSFTARFSQKKYTAILKEFDTPDVGEFCFARDKDGSALVRQEATSPGRKILTVKGDVMTFYQPDIRQAQIANLGKYKNLAEFLALGIGQSPAQLEETFNISYQGSESLNGSPCSILVLKPKKANFAARFASITLWFKKSNGLPIQNKLEEPSGDYVLLDFFDEKLNVKIPNSKFEQELPSGVDIQRLQ
jgi:outer membrane lipoprotein-sorting protein